MGGTVCCAHPANISLAGCVSGPPAPLPTQGAYLFILIDGRDSVDEQGDRHHHIFACNKTTRSLATVSPVQKESARAWGHTSYKVESDYLHVGAHTTNIHRSEFQILNLGNLLMDSEKISIRQRSKNLFSSLAHYLKSYLML